MDPARPQPAHWQMHSIGPSSAIAKSGGILDFDTTLLENMTEGGIKNRMPFGSIKAGTNNARLSSLLAGTSPTAPCRPMSGG